jgi:acyl carrier protein
MSLDARLLKCLEEVSGQAISAEDFDRPLSQLGLDSLETLDLIYQIEKEFDVYKLSSGSLLNIQSPTLADIKRQLLQHL